MPIFAVLLAAATPPTPPPAPPTAPPTVTSSAASAVAITVYRDPSRSRQQPMNLQWLGGFALITETRTIRLPAGDAEVRFEGVADGIVAASAIVTGLPGGVVEKNRDARLLSPAALIDGTLGRAVTLRRTDRATGRTSEEQAIVVAGPAEGVVLRTSRGVEALRCSGLPETLVHAGVPAVLSARPVLSVATHSAQAAEVTVTLSYLSGGFDWSASYVATVAPRGQRLSLFAWLTLANANLQGWRSVQLQAVAGRLERQGMREIAAAAAQLELHCHPLGTTTSDLPTIRPYEAPTRENFSEDIIVTGSALFRAAPPPPPAPAVEAPQAPEDLGDLKLYRVRDRVDLSANAQKQVVLLVQPSATFERVYRFRLMPWQTIDAAPATIALRLRNEEKSGLGIPLPAGTTTLYQPRGATRLLLGSGTIDDTAKGERARLTAGTSPQIRLDHRRLANRSRATLTNANPFPVTVEVAIGTTFDPPFARPSAPLARIDGIQTWRVTLPANGTAALDYGQFGS